MMPLNSIASKDNRLLNVIILLGISAAVAAIAVWYRQWVLEAYIEWDEADYVYAASQGFLANWWHDWDLNRVDRHWHAPMAMYGYRLLTLIFGYESWVIYLQDLIVGSITAALGVWAMWDILRGVPRVRYVAATTCGLIIAMSPANIAMTSTHTMAVFFMLLNIWFFYRYVRESTGFNAILLGVSLAGQFTSMEYGWPLMIGGALILMLVKPELYLQWSARRYWIPFHSSLWWIFISTWVTVMLIWPAGIFKGAVVLNFAYYVYYAKHGHAIWFMGAWVQHLPKYAYAYWYWMRFPSVAIVLALLLSWAFFNSLILCGWRLWSLKGKLWQWKDGHPYLGILSANMAVAGIMVMLILAAHASHIMSVRYSVYMVMGICMAGLPAMVWGLHNWGCRLTQTSEETLNEDPNVGGRSHWIIQAFSILILLGLSVCMFANGLPVEYKYGAGHANVTLSELLEDQLEHTPKGSKVLVQQFPLARYMILLEQGREDVEVVEWDPNNTESEDLMNRVKAGEFQWILITPSSRTRFKEDPLIAYLSKYGTMVNHAHVATGRHEIMDGKVITAPE